MQRVGEVGPEFLRGQLVLASVPLDDGIAAARAFNVNAINPNIVAISITQTTHH